MLSITIKIFTIAVTNMINIGGRLISLTNNIMLDTNIKTISIQYCSIINISYSISNPAICFFSNEKLYNVPEHKCKKCDRDFKIFKQKSRSCDYPKYFSKKKTEVSG